jgi:hypothetical protein
MRTGNDPLGVLVMSEIERLRASEAGLERTLSTFSINGRNEISELSFLADLADIRIRAQRLERVLEAMAGCGYRQAETRPAFMAA